MVNPKVTTDDFPDLFGKTQLPGIKKKKKKKKRKKKLKKMIDKKNKK